MAALAAGGIVAGVLFATTAAAPSGSGAFVSGPPGPEGIPLQVGRPLASPSSAATGGTVDGIQCDSGASVVYHVHTHLSVFVEGELRPIPAGIGIVSPVVAPTVHGGFDEASNCYYWLHVHAEDGVIHIESPSVRSYTLGQFFDIWHQPLSQTTVADVRGQLTVYVNGRLHRGDPRGILLGSHEDIQIDVGQPTVPPLGVDWSGTGL